eukprot:NODE_2685_length_520_cov_144.893130_g2635_i0.p1 GENE.NODE_2685_length_520_cov_144.893130_g2635_i0~~NODE_2685_length_520_cov_144.893130_g2635_i0.p1  ORF type:complete len:129 (+),score=28.17 NODE_2685_length_520_cov_144.893130_g2635_i0:78-464(+)
MSWQEYIDNNLVGTGYMRDAAIIGADGSVWAQSGFELTAEEAAAIPALIDDPTKAQAGGIMMAGVKFMCLRCDAETGELIGKKGPESFFAGRTTAGNFIVGIGQEGINPADLNSTVDGMVKYLGESGY